MFERTARRLPPVNHKMVIIAQAYASLGSLDGLDSNKFGEDSYNYIIANRQRPYLRKLKCQIECDNELRWSG